MHECCSQERLLRQSTKVKGKEIYKYLFKYLFLLLEHNLLLSSLHSKKSSQQPAMYTVSGLGRTFPMQRRMRVTTSAKVTQFKSLTDHDESFEVIFPPHKECNYVRPCSLSRIVVIEKFSIYFSDIFVTCTNLL